MYQWITLLTSICFATWAHVNDPRWPTTATTTEILTNRASFVHTGVTMPSIQSETIDPRRISSAAANMLIDNIINDGASLFIPGADINTPPIEAYGPELYISPPEPAGLGISHLAIYIGSLTLAAAFLQLLRLYCPPRLNLALDQMIEDMWPESDIGALDCYLCGPQVSQILHELLQFRGILSKGPDERNNALNGVISKADLLERLPSMVTDIKTQLSEADAKVAHQRVKIHSLNNEAMTAKTELSEACDALAGQEHIIKGLRADLGKSTEERDLAHCTIAELEQKISRLQYKLQNAVPAKNVFAEEEKAQARLEPNLESPVMKHSLPTSDRDILVEPMDHAEQSALKDINTGDVGTHAQGATKDLEGGEIDHPEEIEGAEDDVEDESKKKGPRRRGKRAGRAVRERQEAAKAAEAAAARQQQDSGEASRKGSDKTDGLQPSEPISAPNEHQSRQMSPTIASDGHYSEESASRSHSGAGPSGYNGSRGGSGAGLSGSPRGYMQGERGRGQGRGRGRGYERARGRG